jgi:hypothetical protein
MPVYPGSFCTHPVSGIKQLQAMACYYLQNIGLMQSFASNMQKKGTDK